MLEWPIFFCVHFLTRDHWREHFLTVALKKAWFSCSSIAALPAPSHTSKVVGVRMWFWEDIGWTPTMCSGLALWSGKTAWFKEWGHSPEKDKKSLIFSPRFYRKVSLEGLSKWLLYLKIPMNSFGKGGSVVSPASLRPWGYRFPATVLSQPNSNWLVTHSLGNPVYETDINYRNA